MSDTPERVVFDGNVFAQVLLNPRGNAARCVDLTRTGQATLFISDFVLEEIRELYHKLPAKWCVTQDDTKDLAHQVRGIATMIDDVPMVYIHPIDADDSADVNLPLAANAALIVSHDNHLLKLRDPSIPWAREFRRRFPNLRILQPQQYLNERDLKEA